MNTIVKNETEVQYLFLWWNVGGMFVALSLFHQKKAGENIQSPMLARLG